jgi:hypothetical protein
VAHRLELADGSPHLPPAEVIQRLEAEFAVVEADAAAGAEHVAAMIRQFERMGVPEAVIDEHRQMQPAAVHLVVADDPNPGEAYLSFAALPGQGLFVGYSSGQHEEAAGPLLARCCRVLGYQPELV